MNKRTHSIFLSGFLLLMLLPLLAGCSRKLDQGTRYQVYYMSLNEDEISSREMGIVDDGLETGEIVDELLKFLGQEPEDTRLKHLLTEGLRSPKVHCGKDVLTLDFPEAYKELSVNQEVLTRAALVKTLTQVKGISGVRILVEGVPLRSPSGTMIGIMQADNFIENPGAQINSSTEDTISLYFANESGSGLVKLDRTIHYSTNVSMEKIIVQQLIDGPRSVLAQSTIPRSTNIINVTVANGICYVNLNEAFINDQNSDILEPVILYSIVNSLTELDTVDKVQISINGETNGKLRLQYDLSAVYAADYSLVEEPQAVPAESDLSGEEPVMQELQTGGLTE